MRRAFLIGVVVCLGAVTVPSPAVSARAHRTPAKAARPATATRAAAPTTMGATAHGWGTRSKLQRDWARLIADGAVAAPAAPVTGNATVTADPSTGLLDGQTISVTGSGLKANTLEGIIECGTGATDITGCDISASLTIVTTDATGSFSTSATVARMITPQSSGTPVDCATAGACVLAVAPTNGKIAADTPIAFADVTIIPPTVAADPSTGLLNGQTITVTGTDFSADASVALVECPAGTPVTDFENDCDVSTLSGTEADGTGAFSASYQVTRVIEGPTGPIDCAGPSACVLAALNVFEPDQGVDTPIAFQDIAIIPPVLTATPSTNLDDGQNITVTGKGFTSRDEIGLSECVAGSTDGSECVLEAGLGNVTEVEANRRGRFTTTFNVARVLTLIGGTIDCAQPPGCVIGAVDLASLNGYVDASVPISFDPTKNPLPPLNLEVHIDPTATIGAGDGHKGNTAAITGTISCDRTTPVPVDFQLQITEAVAGGQAGGDIEGVAGCARGGTKFSLSISAGSRSKAGQFVPGTAGVLFAAFADSGSSAQSTTTNASVTLKAPKT